MRSGISMIHSVKDLSPVQRQTIESLLGRPLTEQEQISVRTVPVPLAPEWLRAIQQEAKDKGLDRLTPDEIDAEIASSRRERHKQDQRHGHFSASRFIGQVGQSSGHRAKT